nr:GGDEF domain-containing protein [Sneathiella chinensis]
MLSLVEQASVDSLTNCYSRNSGEEILDVQFRIAQRQKADLAVVFLDIDNFKIINDQFGHEAGDRILAEAAASMKRNLRDSDVLIRWGGEEFVMLLPNTNAAGAGKAIRRMRTNGFGLRPDGQPVTASIGITDIRSVGTKSWTDLVDQADEEMYRVKTHGKNNVSVVRIANTSIAS